MNTFLRSGVVAVLLTAGVAVPAQADDWGKMALISSTMGTNAGRLCAGAADTNRPSDVGCPTYAPSLTTAGDVSVTGNLSAGKFIGDGSALTGVAAASSDRIVSGSTSMLAVSASGFISVTQGGTNTAWFDPTKGLVALGISTTGTVSGTAGYFSGNVGIGTAVPSAKLEISLPATNDGGTNTLRISNPASSVSSRVDLIAGNTDNTNPYFAIATRQIANPYAQVERLRIDGSGNVGIGTINPSQLLQVSGTGGGPGGSVNIAITGPTGTDGQLLFNNGSTGTNSGAVSYNFTNDTLNLRTAGTANRLVINSAGKVGIGTTAPQATLQVSGSFTVSTSAQTTTPTLYADASGNVGIGTAAPADTLHILSSANPSLRLESTGNSTALIRFQNNSALKGYIGWHSANGGGLGIYGGSSSQGVIVDSSGKVGIGTTAPQAMLQVSGSFTVSTSAQTTTPSLYVGTNGNVGVGTSAPSSALYVASNNGLTYSTTGVGGTDFIVSSTGTSAGGAFAELLLRATGSASYAEAAITAVQPTNNRNDTDLTFKTKINGGNTSEAMRIRYNGVVGIGTITPTTKLEVNGAISATALYVTASTGVVTATTVNGYYASFTTLSVGGVNVTGGGGSTGVSDRISSSGNEAMVLAMPGGTVSFTTGSVGGTAYLDSIGRFVGPGVSITTMNGISSTNGYFTGNVGVGTATPAYKLDVGGTFNVGNTAGTQATILYSGGGQHGRIRFGNNTGQIYLDGSTDTLTLTNGTTNQIASSKFYVGSVGIGTVTPTATLQVSGSFTVSTSEQTTTPTLYAGTNGQVGIGTTSPGAKLQIGTVTPPNIGTPWDLYTRNSSFGRIGLESGNNNAAMEFIESGSRTWGLNSINGRFYIYDNANNLGRAKFLSNGDLALGGSMGYSDSSFNGSKLAIVGDYVGIGTTAPGKALDVSGSANISGTVKIAGLGNEACNPGAYGTMRYTNGNLELCSPGN